MMYSYRTENFVIWHSAWDLDLLAACVGITVVAKEATRVGPVTVSLKLHLKLRSPWGKSINILI
jgi:hypothetical protein